MSSSSLSSAPSAAKKAKFSDLKVNRDLLDPKFEGYKLCLDQLPTDFLQLSPSVNAVVPSTEQWSYQHVRLFGAHNHLHVDPWSIDQQIRRVYVFLADGIYRGAVKRGKFGLSQLIKVLDFQFSEDQNCTNRLNVTISFPCLDSVFVGDGCGTLVFCSITREEDNERWTVVDRLEEFAGGRPFVIVDSRNRLIDQVQFVDVLLQYVEEIAQREPVEDASLFGNVLEWVTFQRGLDGKPTEIARRRLQTKGDLDYAALSIDCRFICTLTSESIRFTYDSLKPVDDTEPEESRDDDSKRYSWGQTPQGLCVAFTVDNQITENDVQWRLAPESVSLVIQPNAEILLEGDLHSPVDVDGSTWKLLDGRLEVTLKKRDVGRMWPEVVIGDQRGEYVADPDLVREVSERLKQFTSDTEVQIEASAKMPFNAQQLEECDADNDDASYLLWLDSETHSVAAEADTGGHQWLFNIRLGAAHLSHICFRHDVDGILWRVHDGPNLSGDQSSTWSHYYTFNAFGYVQAGKPDRRFCTCSTDGSYAVVVDCKRHAYVYWQPTAIDSDLRNRKTGQRIPKVAKQQLISIAGVGGQDASLTILGVAAFDDVMLLLTEDRLIAIFVK